MRNSSVNITAPTIGVHHEADVADLLDLRLRELLLVLRLGLVGRVREQRVDRLRLTCADCVGSLMLNANQPTWPCPKLRASSK